MKPRIRLAEAQTADGGTIALFSHDGDYCMSFNGQELMHSSASASETLLGHVGVAHLSQEAPARILIGGLGLGFTLQSVLESVGPKVTIEVAELIRSVIEWNRVHLIPLNGSFIDDPRVTVVEEDVIRRIHRAKPETYDAILLDIDNGPVAMVSRSNSSLYSTSGIRSVRSALKSGGRAAFWSASPDPAFEARLRHLDFKVELVPAKRHSGGKRAACMLYIATAN